MKKSRFAAVFIVLWLTSGSSVLGAVRQFSTEVDNEVMTGDISISIQEYQWNEEGERVPYIDGKRVVPNEKAVKIVTIVNEAEPAWIRAKAEFSGFAGTAGGEAVLEGIPDGWIKCGAYYYWTRPAEKGEKLLFFDHVRIPGDWSEEEGEKKFAIDVTAQAIQQAHFIPDFQSEDPWFGIPIEQCVHSEHTWHRDWEDVRLAIIFENGADGFFKTEQDFFHGFSTWMPGDTKASSFLLGNRSGRPVDIYFKTRVPGQAEDSIKLLETMTLTIEKENMVIYEGPLHGKVLEEGLLLASLQGTGHEETIAFRVDMPKWLQNQSAMQKARVQWIFSADYISSSSDHGGDGGENTKVEEGEDAFQEKEITYGTISVGKRLRRQYLADDTLVSFMKGLLPKTGDGSWQQEFFTAAVLAGAALLILTLVGKKAGMWGKEESDDS